MEDWISGTFAVLGTLMVLAGAALIVFRTLGWLGGSAEPAAAPPEAAEGGRRFSWRRLSPTTQLIGWGVVLLVVAAVTVGVISFGVSVEAGSQ